MTQVRTLDDLPVLCVIGDGGMPLGRRAQEAFRRLESKLPSLRGRKFYGAYFPERNEYRACVVRQDGDEALELERWTIPGGRYAQARIADWGQHTDRIGPTFDELSRDHPPDHRRPSLEFYRSEEELVLLLPILTDRKG